MIALKPVQSSMIAAMGYEPTSKVLAVRFQNSAFVHHFADVSAETADSVLSADSVGKAFNQHVRGKHEHEILRTEEDDTIVLHDGSTVDTGAPWKLPT